MNNTELFLREKSFMGYQDREVLETLLTTAWVRGDIPELLEKLWDSFGSLKGILEARPEQLMAAGCGKKAATLIAMVAPLAKVWERTNMSQPKMVSNRRDLEAYCKSMLMGLRTEQFWVICVNAQCRIIGARKIAEGSLSEVSAYPRLVMETALNYNAHSVFLSHNHPGGTCAPSAEDIHTTMQLQRLLNGVGIALLDHMIIAGANGYSMAQHGDIEFR